jgi:D-glycero-D-manno-heptose 1,7-bisphosphate phosphatase
MRRGVFLDRDGTLSEEVGYLDHVDRFRLYPWVGVSIRRLNDADLPVVLITNQSGVARGYFPESLIAQVHEQMQCELASAGARIDAFYYCPHHPDEGNAPYRQKCACRKPEIGMLRQASQDLGIDLTSSYVVGDKYLDVETAFRARAHGILVLSGYGKEEYDRDKHQWPRPPDFIAADLAAAVDYILKNVSNSRA